jgi:hypothetical protein
MNLMGLDRVGHDRLEGAQTDMERDLGGVHALGCESREDFGGEMQARGGRGDGDLAGAVGVNGLVACKVLAALGAVGAFDVGREGHFAEAVGDGGNGLVVGRAETNQRRAVVELGQDFTGERARFVGERRADRKFFAGTDEATPHAFAVGGASTGLSAGAEEKAFDLPAGRAAGVEPGGEDGGVIAEKSVAGAEKIAGGRQTYGARPCGRSDRRRAGAMLVATRGRRLCDEMRRERVVEEIGGERRHGG